MNINVLSSTAPLSKPNQYKFNGNEKQTDFDINLYDFNARMYDAALGRFANIDPLVEVQERWTPYHYSYNNPLTFGDPKGLLLSTTGIDENMYDFDVNPIVYLYN